MCPLFAAFDRVNYRNIIPQHISDLQKMPEYIKQHLCLGGFVCSLNGKNFSVVGVDEAHEMCINRIMNYFPVRSQVCTNLKNQVNPSTPSCSLLGIINSSPHGKK